MTPGGRRVQPLAPDQAERLTRRIEAALAPGVARPSPEHERNGAPFQVALSWAGQRHDVSGNLTSTPPPGGDPWSELAEAGRGLVDEARGPGV